MRRSAADVERSRPIRPIRLVRDAEVRRIPRLAVRVVLAKDGRAAAPRPSSGVV